MYEKLNFLQKKLLRSAKSVSRLGYIVTKFEQVLGTTQNTLKYLTTSLADLPKNSQNIWDIWKKNSHWVSVVRGFCDLYLFSVSTYSFLLCCSGQHSFYYQKSSVLWKKWKQYSGRVESHSSKSQKFLDSTHIWCFCWSYFLVLWILPGKPRFSTMNKSLW